LRRSFGFYGTDDTERRFRMAYHIGGIMGFLETWLQDGMQEEPDVLRDISIDIMGSARRPNLMP